jgi:hypothetical protein
VIEDTELFVALAEIAGVFVGFGVLISITGRGGAAELVQLRAVVVGGLLVIAAALIPVGLARYSLEPNTVWSASSIVFLVLIWASVVVPMRNSAHRAMLRSHLRSDPVGVSFVLCLEVLVQVPLVIALLGWYPALSAALYTTALIINLLQAAFTLSQLVVTQTDESA